MSATPQRNVNNSVEAGNPLDQADGLQATDSPQLDTLARSVNGAVPDVDPNRPE
ncbi:MAG: hypothetical protein M3Z32_06385 [Acidobacteriota bacterium]|nr:hypothetical protein [Acidobacteriota bacterium]